MPKINPSDHQSSNNDRKSTEPMKAGKKIRGCLGALPRRGAEVLPRGLRVPPRRPLPHHARARRVRRPARRFSRAEGSVSSFRLPI